MQRRSARSGRPSSTSCIKGTSSDGAPAERGSCGGCGAASLSRRSRRLSRGVSRGRAVNPRQTEPRLARDPPVLQSLRRELAKQLMRPTGTASRLVREALEPGIPCGLPWHDAFVRPAAPLARLGVSSSGSSLDKAAMENAREGSANWSEELTAARRMVRSALNPARDPSGGARNVRVMGPPQVAGASPGASLATWLRIPPFEACGSRAAGRDRQALLDRRRCPHGPAGPLMGERPG